MKLKLNRDYLIITICGISVSEVDETDSSDVRLKILRMGKDMDPIFNSINLFIIRKINEL